MTTRTINRNSVLEITSCCNCGVEFALPENMLNARRRDGTGFYCPNGHTLSYHETELDRQRKRAESLAAQLTHARDQRDAAERSRAALKGEVTKQRRRAAAGVCPCCHRTFTQLTRHMSAKHPDYGEETSP